MPIPHRWSTRRHLVMAAAVVLIGLAAQGLFAWWADPYGQRGTPGPKVIALLGEQRRLFKAHDMIRHAPDLLLCGTSRVEQALEPGHPAIAAAGYTAYNAAMPGSTIHEQLRMVQHAHAHRPLRAVWLELVFRTMDADAPRFRPGFSDWRLATDAQGRPQSFHLLADLPTYLSLETQAAAWRTIRTGSSPRRPLAQVFHRGLFPPENLSLASSNRAAFIAMNRAAWQESYHDFRLTGPDGGNPHLDDLAALAAFCRAQGIALTLFLSPEHAYQAWLIERCGLWPAFAGFKHRVLELAGTDIPVWDFSPIGPLTSEAIPPAERLGRVMSTYNDGGHYTAAVGRQVIATLAAGTAVDGFGVRLTMDGLERELERQRAALRAWAAGQPLDAAEIDAQLPDSMP
jgi:hypothetical protein